MARKYQRYSTNGGLEVLPLVLIPLSSLALNRSCLLGIGAGTSSDGCAGAGSRPGAVGLAGKAGVGLVVAQGDARGLGLPTEPFSTFHFST
jgi:hypothetical protein